MKTVWVSKRLEPDAQDRVLMVADTRDNLTRIIGAQHGVVWQKGLYHYTTGVDTYGRVYTIHNVSFYEGDE